MERKAKISVSNSEPLQTYADDVTEAALRFPMNCLKHWFGAKRPSADMCQGWATANGVMANTNHVRISLQLLTKSKRSYTCGSYIAGCGQA